MQKDKNTKSRGDKHLNKIMTRCLVQMTMKWLILSQKGKALNLSVSMGQSHNNHKKK